MYNVKVESESLRFISLKNDVINEVNKQILFYVSQNNARINSQDEVQSF